MKTKIIHYLALTFLVLTSVFGFGFGCSSSKPTPDPLAGWTFCESQDPGKLDKAIQEDYQDYIQKLPPGERKFAYYAHCFEDKTGQHAVQIEIPLDGIWWEHVLIYDKTNKRVKTVKYSKGGYHS